MPIDSALGRLGIQQGVCTSSTRPTNPKEGQVIYETDTNRTLVYDNAAWVVVADNQVLSIDAANSRVGIGTTSPRGVLDVNSQEDVYLTSNTSQQGTQDTLIGGHVFFVPYGSGNTSYLQARRGDTSGSTEMILRTTNSGTVNDNLKIDSAGRVTTPYQPAFMAHRPVNSAYQTMASADNVLAFNATTLNVGNHYSTSTYRFTAPVSGYYWFSINARIDGLSTSGYYRLSIRKNSTTPWNEPNPHVIFGGVGIATNYQSLTVSGLQYLSAGDYVEPIFTNSGSVGSGFQHESTWSGFLVG